MSFGQSLKVKCCGESASAYISNSPRGIRFGPCFRCGATEYESHGTVSASTLRAWRQADTTVRGMRRRPPLADMGEWPTSVLVWLGSAGVSMDTAQSYHIGYAPSIDRVILPISASGHTKGFLARSLTRSPKYVASFDVGLGYSSYTTNGSADLLVVVEDIMSAIRVHEAGFNVVAVLGTAFNQAVLNKVLPGVDTVVSWLDPDDAGRKAHTRLRKALSLHDVRLCRVQSVRDPKLHTRLEIQSYIQEATDD